MVRPLRALLFGCALALGCAGAGLPGLAGGGPQLPADFWGHWGDGQAELSGYSLTIPRYGQPRQGTAVMIFVTEDFSESRRVKADPGNHPESDVFPVMKLNFIREYQTGVYTYHVMTSTFGGLTPHGGRELGAPTKVSFSAQEWCGHVFHTLTFRPGSIQSVWHSYFDAEGDGDIALDWPEDGIVGDYWPLMIRGWFGEWLAEGERRTVPWLPTLYEARVKHEEPHWGSAVVSREAPTSLTVPAGTFTVTPWKVDVGGKGAATWWVETPWPHHIVAWETPDGERGELRGTDRSKYWQRNQPGGEADLVKLGLGG